MIVPIKDYTRSGGNYALPARVTLASPRAADDVPLAGATRDVAHLFRRAWLARNRLSRLRDNLLLLRCAEDECRVLSRAHSSTVMAGSPAVAPR